MLARQSLPMRRLTDSMVRSGFTAAWRHAMVPTRRSPSFENAITLGVVRSPSAFGTITGRPPSTVAAQLFVVPKSMPIVAMSASFRVEIA
ncbi:hypothetical protein K100096D8_02960 [Eggerthella lenta]